MSNIALLYLLCLWTSATTIRVNNGTTAARATINNDNSSQLLPARERLKRLIPYMTFYLTPAGGQHRTLQSRPVLAVPTKDGGYLQFPQQSPPPSYLVPVVVQPQTFHRQPLSNYPRYLFQQPSPLTKMITQNYLAIAKQQIGNSNNGLNGRMQTRINSYSPQYKHLAVDHTGYKQQQYNEQPNPIIYKQQEQQEPTLYKQPQQHVKIQEPSLIYGGQQIVEEDGIIYKTQANEPSDRGALYKTQEQPPLQQQQHLPPNALTEIQPDILAQFKAQDAILPPVQYKKLLPQQEAPKQYYLFRRPSALYLHHHQQQQQQQQQQPSSQQQQPQYKGSPDDSVTITQSQEIDVSTLPQKYHAKYLAPKPAPVTISSEQYPVSYQQQEEYDTLPLIQHHNDDGILGSSEENVEEQTRVEDVIDGELNNLLGSVSLSKSLPDKITPENLDSSIKTLSKLLRILQRANALPHSAKTLVSNLPRPKEHPFTVKVNKLAQKIPPSDQEGSTPGRAGIDYPVYDEIPPTHFSCREQRYKGFFGDPETGCQVWHYCDLNGGQASFLCPNGTIFSQVALTCDWWFNVKCASTSQLYVLNERLYKYILPQKLSFPEDFQGPLVDQYLALKFKEIEEKNKNKTESATNSSKPQEKEEELPFSEDTATSLNKVRSIPKD